MNTGRTSIPYKGMPTGRAWNLENDDVEAIKKLPEVKYAAGMVWANQFYASHGDRKGEYYVMGHMPDYQKINPEKLVYGRYINDLDMERKRKVCLIGTQIWKDLFPGGEDPTGKTILLQGSQFTVVGVLKRQSNMMTFSDVERTIILPATLVQQMFGMDARSTCWPPWATTTCRRASSSGPSKPRSSHATSSRRTTPVRRG